MQAASPGQLGRRMVDGRAPMGYGVQPVMYQAPVNDARVLPNQPR